MVRSCRGGVGQDAGGAIRSGQLQAVGRKTCGAACFGLRCGYTCTWRRCRIVGVRIRPSRPDVRGELWGPWWRCPSLSTLIVSSVEDITDFGTCTYGSSAGRGSPRVHSTRWEAICRWVVCHPLGWARSWRGGWGLGPAFGGLRRVPPVLLGSRRSCSQGGFLVRAAAFDFSQRQIELPADAFGHLLSFRRVPPVEVEREH